MKETLCFSSNNKTKPIHIYHINNNHHETNDDETNDNETNDNETNDNETNNDETNHNKTNDDENKNKNKTVKNKKKNNYLTRLLLLTGYFKYKLKNTYAYLFEEDNTFYIDNITDIKYEENNGIFRFWNTKFREDVFFSEEEQKIIDELKITTKKYC
jgi:hypothetical protein